jgi:hypothetical protein
MLRIFWSTPWKSGFSLAYVTKAEAYASAEAERRAGRKATVVCATCGESDPDFCSDLLR